MADDNKGITPGPITLADVTQAINTALKPLTDALASVGKITTELAGNQKVLADTLAQLPPAGGKAEPKPSATPLTAESVQDLVAKSISDALGKHQQQTAATAAREQFINQHLAKIPKPYHSMLGTDPAKWSDEAKAIQADYDSHFGKSTAAQSPAAQLSVGAPPQTGSAPTTTIDASKLPPSKFAQLYLPKVPGTQAPTSGDGGTAA